jgi:hypothetical protein
MDKEGINNNEFTSYNPDQIDKLSNKISFDKSDCFENYENNNRLKPYVSKTT